MNFLNRKVSVLNDTERVVQREIEITVERTWTEIRATAIQEPLPVCSFIDPSLPDSEDSHVEPNC